MELKKQIEGYLDSKLSASEKVAFLEEVRTNEDVDLWFRQNIEDAQDSLSSEVKQRLFANICPPVELKRPSRSRTLWTTRNAVAACVVMVLMVASAFGGYFWHQVSPTNVSNQIVKIQTGIGERSRAILPDGTEVALNAMTSVTYDCSMSSGKRQVNVEGEAYFDVAKDAEHPFVIDANQMEVTCLGTALNVRNYADEQTSSVVLVEGKVRVKTQSGDLTMEPDSRVECDKESLQLSKTKVLASNYTCWLKGETRYNNQSLENIARELARNYHINIIITSDELKAQHFTGYLGSCSLRNVLDILTITSDMAYHIDGESVYIYARNTKN